ncbi:MAG: ZIP family metal transporter [Candidatus Thermoplasmatota archaeon]|nr:ZIP family metal transporter [Candidatus Thermoplasmatota archaeon]
MESLFVTLIVILILGPLVGSILGILVHPTSGLLCAGFGFAAGVMISISFLDLIPESMRLLSVSWILVAFTLGFAIMFALDQLLPHFHTVANTDEKANLKRTTLTLIVGISLHNLPEGFAVGAAFGSMADLGLIVAIAIAFHDIPETLVPVASSLATSGSRTKALKMGGLVTAPTLLGFAIAAVFTEHISDVAVAFSLAMTAGIMIYISGDELIPASNSFGFTHIATFSLAMGILFVISMRYFI